MDVVEFRLFYIAFLHQSGKFRKIPVQIFPALSKERIEQMVKFLEDNNFQVFYAARQRKLTQSGGILTMQLRSTQRERIRLNGFIENIIIFRSG